MTNARQKSSLRAKQRRISRACDYCHGRSIRCRPFSDAANCENCERFGQSCTYDREAKKRGAPSRRRISRQSHVGDKARQTSRSVARIDDTESLDLPLDRAIDLPGPSNSQFLPSAAIGQCYARSNGADSLWRAPQIASQATVMDLTELYFEIVYPMFPLFHQPSLTRRIARAEHNSDRKLFALTMAICSLVSARVRDGAVSSQRWDFTALQEPLPAAYYAQAIEQISQVEHEPNLNVLQVYAILALTSIQELDIRNMHQHLGKYHAIVAMYSLHDEASWPSGMGIVETEERRRLFWSIYTLDVFTSIAWGGIIRSCERQSNVGYPTAADDDTFDDTGFHLHNPPSRRLDETPNSVSWIAGRNFVTDLYRLIENIIIRTPVRTNDTYRHVSIHNVLQNHTPLPREHIWMDVSKMHSDLPQCFKDVTPFSQNPKLDRFGFQAADIIATMQLLSIVLLSATGASVAEKCWVANEVLTAFLAIPIEYHNAVSVPLLFHLAVIAQMLGSALEQRISEADYKELRSIMVSMALMLENLEGLHASKGASTRLRDQVAKLDEFMVSRDPGGSMLSREDLQSTATEPTWAASSCPTQVNVEDTLHFSPFQLPPEVLEEFGSIFDFSGIS